MTFDRYGGPDVLRLVDLPVPKVGPGEIRIRVRSAAVNPVDWKIMAGGLDSLMQAYFPVIPGWDVAGVVDAVGPDTPEFRPGDEVIAYARKSFIHDGTFAEFISVFAEAAARKPASLDWDQAAGLPLAGLTAYQLLTRLGLKAGDIVLIHAAAGGVGALGAQIAVAQGARVIGTASEKNHAFLSSLGVEPVTYGEGLAERVRALAPDGVDIVADFVGCVLDVTRAVLRDGGRHASIVDGAVQDHGGTLVWVRPNGRDLQALADMADAGRLTVSVAQTFPLEALAEAFALCKTGRVRGKIAIQVSR
ncbi:MAG TPA: NADP-dependent oxidoreductase [Geminicoccus sp.]|jgi:NADPH:quinone reductase-like Zn-dependent oxidoreductase|nr:NADP-dependent oxidoreductase [Geminicoccus sp.]HEX2525457.1 NADP-dependent oxidoreductase [Geminicoccus sp.]